MARSMVNSGLALEALGHEVEYLFREELATRRMHDGVRRLAVPWEVPLAVRKRARAGRTYDLVEIHEPIASAYCLVRRSRSSTLPPVAALSHGAEERRWRERKAQARRLGVPVPIKSRFLVPLTLISQSRYAFRHAQQAIVLNDTDREYVESELGVPARRVSRVNSGVGESFFSIRRPAERPPTRIVFIGTWMDGKGIHELAEAWREVAGRRTLSLTIIGSKAPEDTVRGDLGSGSRGEISVAGSLTDGELQEELARADIYVLPSHYEGMPLSTLEAAAAGLPCIVSDIPGHAEIFRRPDPESDGAILVPPHDSAALASALELMTSDHDLARELGKRARKRAGAFTWADTARQLEAAYGRTLEEVTSPRRRS